ncbi:hypothetical protein LshimejAT787_1602680 [Lyophyllum shimeji]|uniref:Uncharacterized protein n=1 Tax=Lyophyllum shimeji TaxID=47721 RepID=A0A9P3PYF5_LYOSH|nr:hypothetical protein LshimejAT787_1602680 [Lyophyllum shimeji]
MRIGLIFLFATTSERLDLLLIPSSYEAHAQVRRPSPRRDTAQRMIKKNTNTMFQRRSEQRMRINLVTTRALFGHSNAKRPRQATGGPLASCRLPSLITQNTPCPTAFRARSLRAEDPQLALMIRHNATPSELTRPHPSLTSPSSPPVFSSFAHDTSRQVPAMRPVLALTFPFPSEFSANALPGARCARADRPLSLQWLCLRKGDVEASAYDI